MRNTRRYGGYVIHFGMVLVFIGIAGQAFNKDTQKEMGAGQTLSIGPYTILCQNFDHVANTNYQSERATLEVFRNGRSEMMLYPERRLFLASQVTRDDGGHRNLAYSRPLCRLRGAQPGFGQARDSRVPESAGQMDLVRRHRRYSRNDSGNVAESPRRARFEACRTKNT